MRIACGCCFLCARSTFVGTGHNELASLFGGMVFPFCCKVRCVCFEKVIRGRHRRLGNSLSLTFASLVQFLVLLDTVSLLSTIKHRARRCCSHPHPELLPSSSAEKKRMHHAFCPPEVSLSLAFDDIRNFVQRQKYV